MARRSRPAVADPVIDDRELERRLCWLHRSLFPLDDQSPTRPLFKALARYRAGLERRGLSLAEQVEAVEDWLAEHGRLEAALWLIESLDRSRESWGG